MEEDKNDVIEPDLPISPITDKIKIELKATKPWVRFLSILGFISMAFGLFGMAGMTVAMKSVPQDFPGPPMAMMVGMNLIMIVLYFFPALYLFRYASSIGRLLKEDNIESLETALTYQKSFWRFVGILVIVMFVLGIAMAVSMPMFMKQMH